MHFPSKILQLFGKVDQTQNLDIYSDIKKIKLTLHSEWQKIEYFPNHSVISARALLNCTKDGKFICRCRRYCTGNFS